MMPEYAWFGLTVVVSLAVGAGAMALALGIIRGGSGPIREPQEEYPHEHVEDYR